LGYKNQPTHRINGLKYAMKCDLFVIIIHTCKIINILRKYIDYVMTYLLMVILLLQ